MKRSSAFALVTLLLAWTLTAVSTAAYAKQDKYGCGSTEHYIGVDKWDSAMIASGQAKLNFNIVFLCNIFSAANVKDQWAEFILTGPAVFRPLDPANNMSFMYHVYIANTYKQVNPNSRTRVMLNNTEWQTGANNTKLRVMFEARAVKGDQPVNPGVYTSNVPIRWSNRICVTTIIPGLCDIATGWRSRSGSAQVTLNVTVTRDDHCSINNDQPINVDFGTLDNTTLTADGSRHQKNVPLSLRCTEGLTQDMALTLRADASRFNGQIVKSTLPKLGIMVKHDNQVLAPNGSFNTRLQNGQGQATLMVAPVRDPAAHDLPVGEFNASATLILSPL